MGRKSQSRTLYCSMNGHLVGELRLSKGQLSFQYHSTWLSTEGTRPLSLSLPLQAQEIKGNVVEHYFDNLLPDNMQIRRQIVERLGAASTSPFDLLAQIGRDCVGAVALTETPPEAYNLIPSMIPVAEADIAQTLRDVRAQNTLGMRSDDDFRISLAGAQEKSAFTWWQGRWHKPQKQTATTHIFKPPIFHHESMGIDLSSSVDNEWFCLTLLSNLQLLTAAADIQQFEDQKVLIVERFDRRIEETRILRLPQEDMCQALGRASGSKYEEHGGPSALDIMELLKLSKYPIQDRETFFEAQVVFWLLAAIDGHAKNFSIFLHADGFCLTPLYDVMSAFPYFDQGNIQKQKIKMAMKVHSKNTHYRWHEIQRRHWFSHAKFLGLTEQTVEQIFVKLAETIKPAIEKTFAQAPRHFDITIGNCIAENLLHSLGRLSEKA